MIRVVRKRDDLARVGLVLDQVVLQSGGRHSTDQAFIRFVEAVASVHFERIALCARVRPGESDGPYALDPDRFEVVPLPWYKNVAELCMKAPVFFPPIYRALAAAMEDWDLAIAFGPHPLAPLVLRMARRRNLPAVLWVRGDLEKDIVHRFAGWKQRLALRVARLITRALPRSTPVISMGRDDYPFFSRLGPVCVVYASLFREADVVTSSGPRRVNGEASRLLYVGRIAPEKGVEVLIDALSKLNVATGGTATRLTMVGSDYHDRDYEARFRQRLEASGLFSQVTLAGHVPYGPSLLRYYDSHDVFVLPSYTEGFPLVVLEAMARALPVVATEVGGVPRLVRHEVNGLLIPPGNSGALAKALQRIVSEPGLAERLAVGGHDCARTYAQESQVRSIVDFLANCFPQLPFAASPSSERLNTDLR